MAPRGARPAVPGNATSADSERATSLTPGHLVAVTSGPDVTSLIIWRWYDAVVLEQAAGQVRLWEPNHGEVLAQPRMRNITIRLGPGRMRQPACPALIGGSKVRSGLSKMPT